MDSRARFCCRIQEQDGRQETVHRNGGILILTIYCLLLNWSIVEYQLQSRNQEYDTYSGIYETEADLSNAFIRIQCTLISQH